MGQVTITGTLATDGMPSYSETSSFVLEVEDFFDTTQPVTTTYELLATTDESGATMMWAAVENTGSQEAVVRAWLDGTNYIFFPLPALSVLLIPPALYSSGAAAVVAVNHIHARALSGTSILRVIALFVA